MAVAASSRSRVRPFLRSCDPPPQVGGLDAGVNPCKHGSIQDALGLAARRNRVDSASYRLGIGLGSEGGVMETVRVGRNDLCPCGSGRKFKRCCQNQSAAGGTGRITAFEKARPVFGDGAEMRRHSPQPALRQQGHDGQPIERIPVHYTYAEPFGEAECVYCFPVEQLFLLEDGSVLPAAWLQPGMRFRLEDGSWGTVTAVEPPRVWGPPSRIPEPRRQLRAAGARPGQAQGIRRTGRDVRRHDGHDHANHLFYSASHGAWVPVGSMRPGELVRGETGVTSPILAISPPRHGFIELYGIEVEEFHTYLRRGRGGSALVHNGMGDCFKKPLQSRVFRSYRYQTPHLSLEEPRGWTHFAAQNSCGHCQSIPRHGLNANRPLISRIKDARLEGLGLHTFKDLENVLRYGTPVFQDGGTVAVVYGKLAIIVDPVRKTLVTVQPWK